jgi:hypothetical protein
MIKALFALFKVGEEVQQKGWYASKTVWFNILTAIVTIAALKWKVDASAEDLTAISVGCATVGNIVMRFISSAPVGLSTKPTVQGDAEPKQPPISIVRTETQTNDEPTSLP